MIYFEKVRFKNFGSFGKNMTEIVLDKNNTTLIHGNNGSGKSFAFLDSITYALFGKPFRKINIPQLVNSINEKGCLVEIEFRRGNDKFLVRRGQGPRLFEIYRNGELVNQDAKSLDYQQVLEEQILKMNYKTFTQVVILGSSSFVPFMQLSAADRRSVIENILDINIFSTMNVVLKGKILSLKETLKEINTKLEIEKSKIGVQKSYIESLRKRNNEDNSEKEKQIEELEKKILNIEQDLIDKGASIDEDNFKSSSTLILEKKTKIREYNRKKAELEAKREQKESEIKFFRENHVCPTCSQSISEDMKKSKIISTNIQISDYNSAIDFATEHVEEVEAIITDIESNLEELRKRIQEANLKQRDIEAYRQEIQRIRKTINTSSLVADITEEQNKLSYLEGALELLEEERSEITSDLMYHELASDLLRDGGVKTKIIKYYLPYMNKHINRFLSAMDFFVQFNLDEEFNEQIKSRYRDDFSYMNFSEGEKMRIDLALVLAWREIARLKNSISCNLLILDEVFDSSLDGVGMDELMKLIKMISNNTNVYVISHKSDQLVDKFSNVISFEKKNNFSKMINN